jgi:hypothetical protein
MATNSFLFKGWAITVASALSAFAAVQTRTALLTIALVSTMMFWGMDGYYLWLERGFIELYNKVVGDSSGNVDFSMKFDRSNAACRWLTTCWRPHLWIFYGSIILVDVIGIFLLRTTGNGAESVLQLQVR